MKNVRKSDAVTGATGIRARGVVTAAPAARTQERRPPAAAPAGSSGPLTVAPVAARGGGRGGAAGSGSGAGTRGVAGHGHGGSEHGGSERGTRAQVARLILENGPITAFALGSRLGLTPAAIRRHLDTLLAEGMIEVRKARAYGNRGRGRPAKLFAITDVGRSAFEHAYDDLATSALRFLARIRPEAVTEFAREQVADLEWRYRPVVDAAPPPQRVEALAEALTADGYAASARLAPAGGGQELCQHHCPVAHVAAEFPQLCEAETEAFGRLLGTAVQRLATIAHGDGICTTHITDPSLARAAGTSADAGQTAPPATRRGHPAPGPLTGGRTARWGRTAPASPQPPQDRDAGGPPRSQEPRHDRIERPDQIPHSEPEDVNS